MAKANIDWDSVPDEDLHETYLERVVALKEMFPAGLRRKVSGTVDWTCWLTKKTVIGVLNFKFYQAFLVLFHKVCIVDRLNFGYYHGFACRHRKRTCRDGQITGLKFAKF